MNVQITSELLQSQRIESLYSSIQKVLPDLDANILKSEDSGIILISGILYDVRYAKSLSTNLHNLINESIPETNFETVEDSIHLSLRSASNDWRRICANLQSFF